MCTRSLLNALQRLRILTSDSDGSKKIRSIVIKLTFLHMIVVALSSVCNYGMAQDPRLTSLVMVYSYL